MTNLPRTYFGHPWALVRRNGDTIGKRLSVRMAFLTIPDDRDAGLCKGFIMNSDLTGWTKHARPIRHADVIKQWRFKPTVAEVRAEKRKLPVATVETPKWSGHCANNEATA